jgi:hypothetical protein
MVKLVVRCGIETWTRDDEMKEQMQYEDPCCSAKCYELREMIALQTLLLGRISFPSAKPPFSAPFAQTPKSFPRYWPSPSSLRCCQGWKGGFPSFCNEYIPMTPITSLKSVIVTEVVYNTDRYCMLYRGAR